MKMSEQTTQQIERFLNKTVQKFPPDETTSLLTDIHIRVSQDSGEMISFNDDDVEITRCVVEQWIDNNDEDFYKFVENALQKSLNKLHDIVDCMGIMKPYSFILENDEQEHLAELYLVDNDTVIIGGDLMADLNDDLNTFFENLMKDND
ncbi:MAG: hypothetical protein ACI3YB_04870 [Prevotella sp.]